MLLILNLEGILLISLEGNSTCTGTNTKGTLLILILKLLYISILPQHLVPGIRILSVDVTMRAINISL